MNTMHQIISKIIFLITALVLFAGCQKDENDVTLPGVIFSGADRTSAFVGETVIFSDYSTRELSRKWTFEGGSPAASEDQVVEVTYTSAGNFNATLEVTYENGVTESETMEITVSEEYKPLVTVEGPTYVFYSEDPELPQEAESFGLGDSGLGLAKFIGNAFEGSEAMNLSIDPDASSTFAMLQTDEITPVDITEFAGGYLNLALKSTSQDPLFVRIQAGGTNTYAAVLPGDYGFERDGQWHFISIPMEAVLSQLDSEDARAALLSGFNQFRLRNDSKNFNPDSFEFSADFIFFSVNKPTLNQ